MTLAQRLTAPETPQHGLPCPIATLFATLPDAEAEALRAMLDAPWRVWGHEAIERALFDENHKVGRGTVGKHRRGTCRCRRASA